MDVNVRVGLSMGNIPCGPAEPIIATRRPIARFTAHLYLRIGGLVLQPLGDYPPKDLCRVPRRFDPPHIGGEDNAVAINL